MRQKTEGLGKLCTGGNNRLRNSVMWSRIVCPYYQSQHLPETSIFVYFFIFEAISHDFEDILSVSVTSLQWF